MKLNTSESLGTRSSVPLSGNLRCSSLAKTGGVTYPRKKKSPFPSSRIRAETNCVRYRMHLGSPALINTQAALINQAEMTGSFNVYRMKVILAKLARTVSLSFLFLLLAPSILSSSERNAYLRGTKLHVSARREETRSGMHDAVRYD